MRVGAGSLASQMACLDTIRLTGLGMNGRGRAAWAGLGRRSCSAIRLCSEARIRSWRVVRGAPASRATPGAISVYYRSVADTTGAGEERDERDDRDDRRRVPQRQAVATSDLDLPERRGRQPRPWSMVRDSVPDGIGREQCAENQEVGRGSALGSADRQARGRAGGRPTAAHPCRGVKLTK